MESPPIQASSNTPDGDAHWYMMHVGAGWAVARLPWARRNFERAMRRYHPLYRWLMLDGYGFHEGFFYTERVRSTRRMPPRRLSHHAARVFDQGLGRSMWFSQGADPERIVRVIRALPVNRQADLWSGVGLAASYAGGVDRNGTGNTARSGRANTRPIWPRVPLSPPRPGSGPATRRAHTETACEVFCRMSADEAAAVTDDCLENLPADGAEPAYQVWRAKISGCFSLAGRAADRTMAVDYC